MEDVKLCLFCGHFKLDLGMLDLSDVTPGYSACIGCLERKFEYHPGTLSEHEFRKVMKNAETCAKFEHYTETERKNNERIQKVLEKERMQKQNREATKGWKNSKV